MKETELPKRVSLAEMARIFGMSRERVRQLANEGVFVHAGEHGQYLLEESCNRFVDRLNQTSYGEAAASLIADLWSELNHARAKIAMLEKKVARR